jgi:hypothetical protein
MDEEDTKHKTETVVVSGGGGRGGVGARRSVFVFCFREDLIGFAPSFLSLSLFFACVPFGGK